MRSQSCFIRAQLLAGTIGAALLWPACARAEWCDLLFKEVSHSAEVVLLAEYRGARGQPPVMHVVEVLKGEYGQTLLHLATDDLGHEPRQGEMFLLALNPYHQLIRSIDGMGACSPISVLRLRRGKLQGRERDNYDGGSKPMTLDQLRAELALQLQGATIRQRAGGRAQQGGSRLEHHAHRDLQKQR